MTLRTASRTAALALLALATPLTAGGNRRDDPIASLVAAEASFAADVAKLGLTPGFRAHAAPDSILLRPDPKPALAQLAQQIDDPALRLEWQPAAAAVSRSNDFGFTTGPYRMTGAGKALHGQFLTVWLRGADGRWRWYLDHGLPPVAEQEPTVFPVHVRRLVAGAAAADQESRQPDLAAAEDALNAAIARGDWASVIGTLAEDGQVLRPRHGALSRSDAAKLLPGLSVFQGGERLGMREAGAGDLAASYGRLRRAPGKPGAYYIRIWRREPGGWRLLIDQVT
jgi:ketosteroid isomerase-like protein